MKMLERWVCLNGSLCLEEQAFIPVTDRGFLFGEGIFTTIRVHRGKCELLNGHLLRLNQQAEALGFAYPSFPFDWIDELIARNAAQQGTWRLKIIITIKREKRERESASVGNLFAAMEPYQGQAWEPCALCLFPHPIESPTAYIKSLSYLDHLQARNYAQKLGCHDAIAMNGNGIMLETGCSNLFWINQDVLYLPDPNLPYLKGVFLKALLLQMPLPYQPVKATIEELPANAHVYTCNALTHVRPVISIGGKPFSRNHQWEHILQEATDNALRNDSVYS